MRLLESHIVSSRQNSQPIQASGCLGSLWSAIVGGFCPLGYRRAVCYKAELQQGSCESCGCRGSPGDTETRAPLLRLLQVPKQGRRLHTKPMLGSVPVCLRRQVEPPSLPSKFICQRTPVAELRGRMLGYGLVRVLGDSSPRLHCFSCV